MSEAARHRHNVDRGTFVDVAGTMQPAPAPRFSRTAPELAIPPAHPGQHSVEILRDWGFDAARIDALIASHAVVTG
jgi:alpha-methylacyl-CoA racemase